MSMHLVRGMTNINNKKRKINRKPGWKEAEQKHKEWLKSMGIKDTKSKHRNQLPDLSTDKKITSDTIPDNGIYKTQMKYTGNEIAGIVTTHKSNLMPVRKDNKQAIVDAAHMRRN